MAPLAGKPPFATDEPDSVYDTPAAARPRLRQPAPEDPNKRTSAYNVYDNYIGNDKNDNLAAPATTTNRNSGIGAMLLNMGDDSDSEDDDDESYRRRPTKPPGISTSPSKNAMLAAAVSAPSAPRPSPPQQVPAALVSGPPQPQASLPQQQQPSQQPPQHPQAQPPQPPAVMRGPPPPGPGPISVPPMQQHEQQMQNKHIAAPRPGYPAPIAALNLARPEMSAVPAGRQPQPGAPVQMPNPQPPQQQRGPPMPAPIRIPQPMDPMHRGAFTSSPVPGSPAPSTPHPLHPPVTPITPAFIRPSKSPVPGTVVAVSFEEGVATPRKPIMRGNSEETLLPSRGEKGDDFWRRFSMVVKEESKKHPKAKESSWLRETRAGSKWHSRRVWIIGIIFIILIGGGIGCGVYFTRNNPSHEVPTVIGGGASFTSGAATSTSHSGKATKSTSSSRHVSPTNTVERRAYEFGLKNRQESGWDAVAREAAPEPAITPAPTPTPCTGMGNASAKATVLPAHVRRHKNLKKRLDSGLVSF